MQNERLSLMEFVYEWKHDGGVITFSWLGNADVKPDRVYALAFTPDRKMLLVTDPKFDPACWLPGGRIEDGETAEKALARELVEEANATVHRSAKIGTQRVDDSVEGKSYGAFYWCRVTVDGDFSPKHEVTERYLVTPAEFLDRLYWGRTNPIAAMLLERTLEIEQTYESH